MVTPSPRKQEVDSFRIGIQLYTVREALKEDFKGTLAQLARIGFEGVELAYYYGELEPDELARYLHKIGLEAIGIYEKPDQIGDPDAAVYRYAQALDCPNLTFGIGPAALDADFQGCLDKCRRAVQAAATHGKTVCYHAHAHEFRKVEGISQLDRLLNEPGLETMALEADTCWIHRGGEDVPGFLEKYAGRIPLLHVKDTTAEGGFTELGRGVIDFAPVLDFARRHRIPWVDYEQDVLNLPGLESPQVSLNFLQTLMDDRKDRSPRSSGD